LASISGCHKTGNQENVREIESSQENENRKEFYKIFWRNS